MACLTHRKDISWIDMSQPPANNLTKRSRASLIILIVLALLLMASVVFLVYHLPDDDAWQLMARPEEAIIPEDIGFDCEPVEAQRLYPFGEGLYKVSISRVARLDNQGHERFAADIDFKAPFVVSDESHFLVADREGHQMLMLGEHGELYKTSVEGRISSANISSRGYVLIVQDKANSTGVVSLFAPETGRHLFDIHFPESGYVLSASFSPSGDYFDISILNTASATAVPIIRRYNLEGQALGQRMPDLAGLYPLIFYSSDDQIVLSGANSLVALAYDHSDLLWQRHFNQILSVFDADRHLYVIAAAELDGPYALFKISGSGEMSELIHIGEAPAAIDHQSNLAAIASGTRVMVIDLTSGALLFEKQLPAEIIRLRFTNESALLVVVRTGVRRVEIV